MQKVVAYAIVSISSGAFDLWGVVETKKVALADYRNYTGKPGRITREETGPGGHPIYYLDESKDWMGVISRYHVAPAEYVEED